MNIQCKLGLLGAGACFFTPLISRAYRGIDWIAQYVPDAGIFSVGTMFFIGFSAIPSIIVFIAFMLSKNPLYAPGVLSLITCLSLLAKWHHDNDISSDPQAAISLVFIPIYSAAIGIVAALIGLIFQLLIDCLRESRNTSIP